MELPAAACWDISTFFDSSAVGAAGAGGAVVAVVAKLRNGREEVYVPLKT